MKKLMALLLTAIMVSSLLCGMTVFAADPTIIADKDWENGVYDSSAQTLSNGTYTFNITRDTKNKKLTITALTAPEDITEVYVPRFNDGSRTYATVTIATGAFVDYPAITKVVGMDALAIQTGVFNSAVTALDITAGTTVTLGDSALVECTGLKTVTVTAPTSVTVGDLRNGYPVWTAVEKIDFNTALVTANKYAFSGCNIFDKIYINDVVLGEKLATEDDSLLFKVTIPATLVRGGDYCFGSSYIEHIIFAEGTTAVGQRACQGCSNLKYVDFPQSLTSIGAYAFYNCGKLISLDSSVPADANPQVWDLSRVTSIGNEALYCKGIKGELILGVTTANKQAIRSMPITKVTYVNPVTTLAQNAFYQMSSLKEIVFEQGPAPTDVNSTWRNSGSAPVVIYPDTEMESWKAFPYPERAKAIMPFGAYVSTFAEGAEGSYDVTYAVANYKEKNIGTALVALYDAQDIMIGAKTVDATVGTTLTSVNVPANGTAASAKIFVVDGLSTLNPQYVNYEYVPVVEEVPAE